MDRRHALAGLAALAAAGRLAAAEPARRPIARDGTTVPAIGLGTWLAFDVGDGVAERERRAAVLDAFFAGGGGMIDSSPMYGRAERVVGDLLAARGGAPATLYAATKVWTPFDRRGAEQVRDSLALWRLPRLDLVHVHNLLNWQAHLATLRELRARGLVRHVGVTTSHGRRHDELLAVVEREPLDAIQLSYSLADASAEKLIDAAAARGIAVIANRPFDGGALVDRASRLPLPGWAAEIGCASWAQVLLKWIVARPGVACAIPATTNPAHMAENLGAARPPFPDAALRRRIARHLGERL